MVEVMIRDQHVKVEEQLGQLGQLPRKVERGHFRKIIVFRRGDIRLTRARK